MLQAFGVWQIYHDTSTIISPLGYGYFAQVRSVVALCFLALSFFCITKCILTHPGVVPVDWDTYVKNKNVPISHSDPNSFHPRSAVFCKACQRPRPERAYHCEQEGICVMKFDCWIPLFGQSIGLRNAKLYLLSTWYSALIFIWVAWVCGREAFDASVKEAFTPGERAFSAVMFLVVYIPLGTLSLVAFFMFFTRCAINRTYQERNFTARNPYDLGFADNMKQVLGKFSYEWFMPYRVEYPDNAGLFFPVNIPVFEGKYGAMVSNEIDE